MELEKDITSKEPADEAPTGCRVCGLLSVHSSVRLFYECVNGFECKIPLGPNESQNLGDRPYPKMIPIWYIDNNPL